MATKQKDWKAEWVKISAESRKLAKRANQRMVRLERAAKLPGMKNILKYAYNEASTYIVNSLGGNPKKPRFKESIKLYDTDSKTESEFYKRNVQIQKARIKEMENFLGAASSTIGESRTGPKTKGIKAIYDQRAGTISALYTDKYGERYTANDLKRFFDSKKQAKLESVVGSKQMFIVAKIIKKENIKGSRKELEKYVKTHVDTSGMKAGELEMKKSESRAQYLERMRDRLNYTDDKVLNDLITNALKEGINADNIFMK